MKDKINSMVVDVSSEIPKMFMQSNRFKKSMCHFTGKGGSPLQVGKSRNSKEIRKSKINGKNSPNNSMFKYSLNGFINSKRFIKNYQRKERNSTGKNKHLELLNKISTGKKRDSKKSTYLI